MTAPATLPLARYLEADDAADLLVRYYQETDEERLFTGRWFDSLGRGGRQDDADPARFNCQDIVAVAMLSVQIPARATIEILDRQNARLNELLTAIPDGVDIFDSEAAELLVDGGVADELWNALTDIDDVGWVTANKLLARKRPELMPVYDQVVRGELGTPERFWTSLHHTLVAEGWPERLADLHRAAGLPEWVSLLRIVDVVIWMKGTGRG